MVEDTLRALELGAVEDLIIWDNLETQRLQLRNQVTGEEKVIYLNKDQESEDRHFRDPVTNVELDTIEKEPLVEWFANNYKQFGCNLEFVTDRSGEGTQFVKGFGGIGGLLRWKVDFAEMNSFEDAANMDRTNNNDDDSDDNDDDDNVAKEYGFDDGDYGF
jgi:peptide chain release factor subunit 1